MGIFETLSLIGGLALFLFGMKVMGDALEKKAGSQLKTIIGRMTNSKLKGFMLGLGVTAVIQSSSATTVMIVGFVNSGIMELKNAISIIMGANVGTAATAWILSLTAIEGNSLFLQLLKPSSFTPVLALIGVVLLMFAKRPKKRDTGMILLGFAVLMTGMEMMSDAVAGLKDVPQFTNILTLFSNPILGVLAGAVLTAIIQSSSASVGILQALSTTGVVSYATAIPVIMGQNIGTCVTAMLSAVGTNKDARRAALIHLYFNVIGTVVLLAGFYLLHGLLDFAFVQMRADQIGIAVVHTCFKLLCTVLLMPFSKGLEKLACLTIKDTKETESYVLLDERLLVTPAVAVERCVTVATAMAERTKEALFRSFEVLKAYNEEEAEALRVEEDKIDKYEDKLGAYLVKLSAKDQTAHDTVRTAAMMRLIGDIERISDHSVNIVDSAEEMHDKKLSFSEAGKAELRTMLAAVRECVEQAMTAILNNDLTASSKVEALEQIVDDLQREMKTRHVLRLQKGACTIEQGFILQDILTNLERISDHCSNIAGYVLEIVKSDIRAHELQRDSRGEENVKALYAGYKAEYTLPQA